MTRAFVDTTEVTDLFRFRFQKGAVTNKQATLYLDPDSDGEALDSLLGLFGEAALNQKRSELKRSGRSSESKDGAPKSPRALHADDTPEQ